MNQTTTKPTTKIIKVAYIHHMSGSLNPYDIQQVFEHVGYGRPLEWLKSKKRRTHPISVAISYGDKSKTGQSQEGLYRLTTIADALKTQAQSKNLQGVLTSQEHNIQVDLSTNQGEVKFTLPSNHDQWVHAIIL